MSYQYSNQPQRRIRWHLRNVRILGRRLTHQRSAFTLIELLVVTAVFALVALTATTVITNIQTTQRQILGKQRVTADGRYALEMMARTVRQNFVDYSAYGPGLSPRQTYLATRDKNNVQTKYIRDTSTPGLPYLKTTSDGGITWSKITPDDLKVTRFDVYITPASDPFAAPPSGKDDCADFTHSGPPVGYDAGTGACDCGVGTPTYECFDGQRCELSTTGGTQYICQNPNVQPQVTIILTTQTVNQASGQKAQTTLQTTVTSHVYRR